MSKSESTAPRQATKRTIDRILAVGGLVVVLTQATILAVNPYELSPLHLRGQLLVLVVGLALNQVGVWHLAQRVFSGRRYLALRNETDRFVELVRELNRQALAGDREAMQRTRELMHASVGAMDLLAGVDSVPALASGGIKTESGEAPAGG